MTIHRPLFVLVSALALVLASCAPNAQPAPSQQGPQAAPAGELLYVEPDGSVSEVHLLDAAKGTLVRKIPWGVADQARVHRVEARDGKSVLRTYDAKSGALVKEHGLGSSYTYELPVFGPFSRPTGLSPNGRWLVLQARGVDYVTKSAFLVVNLETGATTPVELEGNFSFDAISNLGTPLYLEENLPVRKPTGYRVRAYDVESRSLVEGAVIDKTVQVDQMQGTRLASVASGNGEWVHNLYVSYAGGKPFIHSLNLAGRFSVCLFPTQRSGVNTEEDAGWGLTPAPDGRTAYVTNAFQGVVAELDLNEAKFRRTGSVKFARTPDLLESIARWFVPLAQAKSEMFAQGAVSPDGKMLYLLGEFGHGIVAISTDTLAVVRRIGTSVPMLTALAVSTDGAHVYASDEGRSILKFDAQTGEAAPAVRPATRIGRILRVIR